MTGDYEIGIVGLGVMGRNLALNIADKGYPVAGYDKDRAMITALGQEGKGRPVVGAVDLGKMTALLRPPRAVMVLVPSGVVDAVLEELMPHLRPGDVVMDGGNSHFRDTDRRGKSLAGAGILFMGVGISGGEKGARTGPSIMPGGPKEGYDRVSRLLEAIAARVDGEPCVAYLGHGSTGHYVKMIHNGIEYGIIQLIAESYHIMKHLGIDNDGLHGIYEEWSRGPLGSYLMEITACIFSARDGKNGPHLIDLIVGEAEAKGTGKWTAQDAMDLGMPAPAVGIAVSMRDLSHLGDERRAASRLLGGPDPFLRHDRVSMVKDLQTALKAAFVIVFAQGFAQLKAASEAYGYGLKIGNVARIWRGGCIIRSNILDPIREVLDEQPKLGNLLLDERLGNIVAEAQAPFRRVVSAALDQGIPVPCLAGCLTYYDAYRSAWLPANLIQAQRDYFGAHRYRRIDKEGLFHTEWEKTDGERGRR